MHTIERKCLYNDKSLRKLCGLFDKTLALQLLSRFYDINLKPMGSEKNVNYDIEGYPRSVLLLSLDQLQTELLNVVCITGVQAVKSDAECVYVDIPGLLETFPHLHKLQLSNGDYFPYCGNLKSDRDMCISINHVSLKTIVLCESTLPKSHVHCLLQLSQLSHLALHWMHILPILACSTEPLWPHKIFVTLMMKGQPFAICYSRANIH